MNIRDVLQKLLTLDADSADACWLFMAEWCIAIEQGGMGDEFLEGVRRLLEEKPISGDDIKEFGTKLTKLTSKIEAGDIKNSILGAIDYGFLQLTFIQQIIENPKAYKSKDEKSIKKDIKEKVITIPALHPQFILDSLIQNTEQPEAPNLSNWLFAAKLAKIFGDTDVSTIRQTFWRDADSINLSQAHLDVLKKVKMSLASTYQESSINGYCFRAIQNLENTLNTVLKKPNLMQVDVNSTEACLKFANDLYDWQKCLCGYGSAENLVLDSEKARFAIVEFFKNNNELQLENYLEKLRLVKNKFAYNNPRGETRKAALSDFERALQTLLNARNVQRLCDALDSDYQTHIPNLLQLGVNINSKDFDGQTVLHHAIAKNDYVLIEYLIKQGIDIDKEDNDYCRPIAYALKDNKLEAAKSLLMFGAEPVVEKKPELGYAPATVEKALESNPEMLAKLDAALTTNLEYTTSAKKWGAKLGDYVKESKEEKTSLRYLDVRYHDRGEHCTLLQRAVKMELAPAIIDSLCTATNVNIPNGDGQPPLYALASATPTNSLEVAKSLLAKGANPNSIDDGGNTPLHEAIKFSRGFACWLLENGANPYIRNIQGISAMDQFERLDGYEQNRDYIVCKQLLMNSNARLIRDKLTLVNISSPEDGQQFCAWLKSEILRLDAELERGNMYESFPSREDILQAALTARFMWVGVRDVDLQKLENLRLLNPKNSDLKLLKRIFVSLLDQQSKLNKLKSKLNAPPLAGAPIADVAAYVMELKEIILGCAGHQDMEIGGKKKTALHMLAESKSEFDTLVGDLFKDARYKPNLTAKDSDGQTALHVAIQNDNFKLAELLVDKGAPLIAINSKGETPWDCLKKVQKPQNPQFAEDFAAVKQSMLKHSSRKIHSVLGDRFNKPSQATAADRQVADQLEIVVRQLCEMLSDEENSKREAKRPNPSNDQNNNVVRLMEIFDKTPSPTMLKRIETIMSPGQHPHLVELRLAMADLMVVHNHDNLDKSHLHDSYLVQSHLKDMNPNLQDSLGQTMLHHAVVKGKKSLVEFIAINSAKRGIGLNVKDKQGKTPLHHAIEHNKFSIALDLLKYGANPFVKDNEGKAPFHRAVEQQNFHFAQIILDMRAPKAGELEIDKLSLLSLVSSGNEQKNRESQTFKRGNYLAFTEVLAKKYGYVTNPPITAGAQALPKNISFVPGILPQPSFWKNPVDWIFYKLTGSPWSGAKPGQTQPVAVAAKNDVPAAEQSQPVLLNKSTVLIMGTHSPVVPKTNVNKLDKKATTHVNAAVADQEQIKREVLERGGAALNAQVERNTNEPATNPSDGVASTRPVVR